ncbi:MAG: rhodanese-like domain-containing protein [Jejuia sp.]
MKNNYFTRHYLLLVLISVLLGCNSTSDGSVVLNIEEFQKKIENNNVQLVDVRTPEEFKTGHIQNALNINYFSDNFEDSLKLLDVNRPVYIYCKSGKRSSKSVAAFKAVGFDSIYQLQDGFLNWTDHHLKE